MQHRNSPNELHEYPNELNNAVKVSGVAAGAIGIAVELLRNNDGGKCVTAEEFLDKVADSPDTRMTSGALMAAGSGWPAHGAEVSFDPNIFGSFPKHLESKTEYRMLLSDFADVCPSSLKAGFQRLLESGVTVENRVGKLLHTRKRLPVYLSGSADGLLFRVAASAGLELDAFVTVTISTDERRIIGYTLARLTDPEKTLQQLEDMLRNQIGREPLTANLV